MPHVCFVTFSGFRVREQRLLDLGMTLPGLTERANALHQLPGLGLLTLAGMLPEAWECSYFDKTDDLDTLFDSIASKQPDLVAISALTASVEQAYSLCDRLRAVSISVVMGGLHVTACPGEAQQHCDAAVVGEGEAVWPQVLADAEQGELRPLYDARLLPAADWVSPRLDLLDGNPQRFTLQTQRGCPFACEFCAASRLLGGFREKPTARISHELDAIRAMAATPLIELADDNTFAGDRPPEELFQTLAASGVRYFTESDWLIGERPDLLSGLAASGCVQVLLGVESSVFRYPGMGRKAAELERVLDAVRAIQASGVAVNGCFILGADGETHDSIDRLVQFLNESPFADVQLTLQTPFPGARLYDRLRKAGRLLGDRGWSYYTLFDATYQPDRMSVEQLERAFEAALAEVYSQAATTRRRAIRKEVWSNNPCLKRRNRA